MTKDDIIKLAREAGLTKGQHWNKDNMTTAFMCDFANLVAAAEREACAKVIEAYPYWLGTVAKQEIAAAIRARGTDMTWPFPTKLPPNRPIPPMPFNPNNHEESPL